MLLLTCWGTRERIHSQVIVSLAFSMSLYTDSLLEGDKEREPERLSYQGRRQRQGKR